MLLLCITTPHLHAQWKSLGGPERDSAAGAKEYPTITSLFVTNCEIFAGTDRGLFISTDGSNTWTRADSLGNNLTITAFVRGTSTFYAGTDAIGVFYSDGNVASWWRSGTLDSILCMAVNDSFILAGTPRGMQQCRAGDSSNAWAVSSAFGNEGVVSVAVRDSIVIAGGSRGSLLRSADYGKSWAAAGTRSQTQSPVTSCSFVGDTIIVSQDGALYLSPDRGATFVKLEGTSPGSFGYLTFIDSILFALSDGSVYYSVNYGADWLKADSGNDIGGAACLFTAGKELYVGTAQKGIWHCSFRDSFNGVARGKQKRVFPSHNEYGITCGYFGGNRLALDVKLPQPESIQITVCNARGVSVISPVQGLLPAGKHRFSLPAGTLSPGWYMVKMSAGEQVVVTRFVVVR